MNSQTTAHLTTAQLDNLLFNTEAAAYPHLLTCATCAAELEALHTTFASLRSTTAAVAKHQHHIARRPTPPARNLRAIGSLAAAALVLALSIPATLHWTTYSHPTVANHPVQPVPTAPATKLTDEQLLATVQTDLSASVPNPMLPLASTTSTSTR